MLKVGTNNASFGGSWLRYDFLTVYTSASSLPYVLFFMSNIAVRYRRTRSHASLWRVSPIDNRLRLAQMNEFWWGLDVDTKVGTVRTHECELATVCAVFYEQDRGTASSYALARELVEGISD